MEKSGASVPSKRRRHGSEKSSEDSDRFDNEEFPRAKESEKKKKLPGMNITPKEFERKFRKALSVPFQLHKVCGDNVNEFVNAYSSALGCSEKTFFFPFLTSLAACMGTDCYLELTASWQEPPIIWTLIIKEASLLRINVAEYLKQELLQVQTEIGSQEDNSDIKKFVFDLITIEQLEDFLKTSNGHGLGLYNSIHTIKKHMVAPEDAAILHRLHYGLSWFKGFQHSKKTLMKTRVNMSVISTPSAVQETLNTVPDFQELFFQCFLTVCSEETHPTFSQISTMPETQKLRDIFHATLKLHSSGPIVYKLSAEAKEKFGQIHADLSEKAIQVVKKYIDNKVFQPALSYLGRLSCVLHVFDNIIHIIKHKIPLSESDWNTEISAANVQRAREILGYIVEQRHAFLKPSTLDDQEIELIDLDEEPDSPTNAETSQAITNNSSLDADPSSECFSLLDADGNAVPSSPSIASVSSAGIVANQQTFNFETSSKMKVYLPPDLTYTFK